MGVPKVHKGSYRKGSTVTEFAQFLATNGQLKAREKTPGSAMSHVVVVKLRSVRLMKAEILVAKCDLVKQKLMFSILAYTKRDSFKYVSNNILTQLRR